MSILQTLGLRRSPRNHRAGARTTTSRKHNNILTGPGGLLHHKKRANKSAGYKVCSYTFNIGNTHSDRIPPLLGVFDQPQYHKGWSFACKA